MMMTLLFVVLIIATFAALGRAATPARERRPLMSGGFKSLGANVRRGFDAVTPPWTVTDPSVSGLTATRA
ncbi:hypothetical protein [Arthrobacter sp. H14]|uniref:hypothetical protein n=1 Tax=Arthrobacter sp. H14 TaxID=1312959 RepID=UPI00047ADA1A|nr:hypothetical protein [Arthrobacter sp. H14]